MRITILPGSVPNTTFIDSLVNVMAAEGYNITLVGKKSGVYNYIRNVEVIIVPQALWARVFFIIKLILLTGAKHTGKIWKAAGGIKQFYADLLFYLPVIHSNPDRIHLQWAAFIHNRDLLFELFPGKVLVSMRGAHINYTPITTPPIRESYLRLFPKVHRFHAVSRAIAAEAVQYGAAPEKTDVVYSFVDDALLQYKIQPKTASEQLRIISVGRFFWKKGYEYALDALTLLHKEGVNFQYTLIAEGDTPAGIIYQVHQSGLTDCVKIVNGATHEEVLKAIEEHDVLLLPSVEEGIANVVLEAMAVGTPVITTDVGGMKETIEDGISGYVVKVRDAYAMCNALTDFNSLDAEKRFAMAKRAKENIAARHDKKTFISMFKQFYTN